MPKKYSKNGGHGGKRTGAGKPKGRKNKKTIEQEKALEFLREKVRKKWGGLINAKMDLALGAYVLKKVAKGKKKVLVRIYKARPDSNSLEYLFSMVAGKPKESLDVSVTEVKVDPVELRKFIEWRKKQSKKQVAKSS